MLFKRLYAALHLLRKLIKLQTFSPVQNVSQERLQTNQQSKAWIFLQSALVGQNNEMKQIAKEEQQEIDRLVLQYEKQEEDEDLQDGISLLCFASFFFFFPFEFQKKRLMYLHRYHCQKQSFEGWETSEQKTQSANILSDWRTAQTIQQTPTTKPKGIDSYDEWTIYRDLLDLTLRSGPPRPQGISCVAVPFQCVCKKFQQQEIEKALYYTNQ